MSQAPFILILRQDFSLAWISAKRLGCLDLHISTLSFQCWDYAILSFSPCFPPTFPPSLLSRWVLDVQIRSLCFKVKHFTDGAVSLRPSTSKHDSLALRRSHLLLLVY